MAKEVIRFKGLSLNKDEQSAAHGELALCANVELHDGALRPSVLEGSMVQHEVQGEMVDSTLSSTLKYVHETPSYRHFIGEKTLNNEVSLYWYNADGTEGNSTAIHTFDNGDKIISIESVGNTLVVMADSGVHYVLWKEDNYKYIGDKMPFLYIWFRRSDIDNQAEYDRSTLNEDNVMSYVAYRRIEIPATDIFSINNSSHIATINSGYKSTVSEGIRALINQSNNTIAKDGHFYAPFLIRYCYRLYDGSMVMHSPVMFVDISTPFAYSYIVRCGNFEMDGSDIIVGNASLLLEYYPNNRNLQFCVWNVISQDDTIASLRNDWSDIIKSVDIFVSPMMAPDKIDEQIDSFSCRVIGQAPLADIPLLSNKEYHDRIKASSNFFKIASWQIEDIGPGRSAKIPVDTNFHDLEFDKTIVQNLTTQEAMKDDYRTHCQLIPAEAYSGMYVYNHRVNLYGIKEKLFEGFPLGMMRNNSSYTSGTHYDRIYYIMVKLNTDDGVKYVKYTNPSDSYSFFVSQLQRAVFFYPDSRATNMILYFKYYGNDTLKKLDIPLEPSDFLNGTIGLSLFDLSTTEINNLVVDAENTLPDVDDMVPMLNKVITSEVDNPFYFPLEGRNTVGVGYIKGIAAVTRALSQGQVGDHDLIAFSTDGIWVMKVASTGLYSAIHNISREVCSNPKTICQLDQSVVFATERNLSRFVESDVLSISEVLDGPIPNWSTLLPTLVAAFPNNGTAAQQTINKLLAQMPPAVQLFNQGSVFYDYASKRIVVLPAANASGVVDAGVAMVFSIRDEAWSTMAIPSIQSVIPGYPSPFVQLGDGKVMILDKTYGYAGGVDTPTVPGLIITRTLTFSDTMDVIRGYTQYADSAIAPTMYIFGSNDQRSWQSLGTSNRWFYNYMPGRPYRFFRIAVYMQMKPSEEYQQVEMEAINKYAKL